MCVLNRALKLYKFAVLVINFGSEFHSMGPFCAKDLEPVLVLVRAKYKVFLCLVKRLCISLTVLIVITQPGSLLFVVLKSARHNHNCTVVLLSATLVP